MEEAMRRFVVMAVAMLGLGGCQDERPAMSLDEARRVQAGFQGQSAFVPPPRTISDITALLDQASPDPARVATLRAASDAQPPANASAGALYDFHQRRGQARGELGLLDGQHGLMLAIYNAEYTYYKYLKLKFLQSPPHRPEFRER